MGMRCGAVTSISRKHRINTFKFAMMFFASQGCKHLVHEIVDIEQFKLHRRVIDLNRQIMREVVAKCGYGRIVVGTTPFTEQIRETVDQHLCSGFLSVVKEQFLARLLALSVGMTGIAAYQGCLNGTAQHHRATVAMLPEGIE